MALVKRVRPLGSRGGGSGTAERRSSARPEFVAKEAPCAHACPAGTDVRGFLITLARGERTRPHRDAGRRSGLSCHRGSQSAARRLRVAVPASLRNRVHAGAVRRRRVGEPGRARRGRGGDPRLVGAAPAGRRGDGHTGDRHRRRRGGAVRGLPARTAGLRRHPGRSARRAGGRTAVRHRRRAAPARGAGRGDRAHPGARRGLRGPRRPDSGRSRRPAPREDEGLRHRQPGRHRRDRGRGAFRAPRRGAARRRCVGHDGGGAREAPAGRQEQGAGRLPSARTARRGQR